MNRSLWEISDELHELMEGLSEYFDEDGQITDEEGWNAAIGSIETLEGSKEDKIMGYASYFRYLSTQRKALAEDERMLEAKKREYRNKQDWIKMTLSKYFPEGSKPLTRGKVSVKWSKPEKLIIDNGFALPSDYTKPKYKNNPLIPDKDKIEKALKAGEDISGAHLERVPKINIT